MGRRNGTRRINPYQFEGFLASALQGINLSSFVRISLDKLSAALAGAASKAVMPPHLLLKAVDSACAYCDHNGGRIAAYSDLQRVIEVFMLHEDNCKTQLLRDLGIHSMMLQLQREQFRIQRSNGASDVGRAYKLLRFDQPSSRLNVALKEMQGYSVRDWITVHTAAYGSVLATGANRLADHFVRRDWAPLIETPSGLARVLGSMAHSCEYIRQSYYESRGDKEEWYAQSFLLPSFYDRPLLQIGDKYYCASGDILLDNMIQGITSLQIEGKVGHRVDDEIHRSQVEYIAQVLHATFPGTQIVDEDALRDIAAGRQHCDVAVVHPKWILLIEAKSFRRVAQSVAPESMGRHGMAKHLITGLEQVESTAEMVGEIVKLAGQEPTMERAVLGVVVTLQNIEAPNSEWFRESVLRGRDPTVVDRVMASPHLSCRPVIWDLRTLDTVAMYCAQHQVDLYALFKEREQADFMLHGDWSIALGKRISRVSAPLLALWASPLDEHYSWLGARRLS